MKTVGFIDYYISEWHANNYPAWLAEAGEALGEEIKVSYVWAELEVSPVDGVTTDEWCEKYGAVRCESIAELCERADYICILSPSNPERHLDYVKEAFASGKRCYVDKTFAPTLEVAKEIFSLGERYSTPFFSTSALRYASELEGALSSERVRTTGGGSSFDEYIIHQVEMLVKLVGCDPKSVLAKEESGGTCHVFVDFESGKRGEMSYSAKSPFTVTWERSGAVSDTVKIASPYFKCLMADIVRFYLTGEYSFDRKETLAVAALREAAIKAKLNTGRAFSVF